MKRFVKRGLLTAVTVVVAFALSACGGEGEKRSGPGGSGEAGKAEQAAQPAPEPKPEPEPAKPARTALTGKGKLDGDAGATPEVVVELSYGDDKVVEGTLRIGETARRIGGVIDGDRLRCWLSGGDDGGAVQRGMLNGEAREGGGFAGSFAVSNDGAVEAVRGSWEAAPE